MLDVQARFGLSDPPFTREIATQMMWRQPGLDDLVRTAIGHNHSRDDEQ
jgi:hypothetical protein